MSSPQDQSQDFSSPDVILLHSICVIEISAQRSCKWLTFFDSQTLREAGLRTKLPACQGFLSYSLPVDCVCAFVCLWGCVFCMLPSEYKRIDPAPTPVLSHSWGKHLAGRSAANLVCLPPDARKGSKRKEKKTILLLLGTFCRNRGCKNGKQTWASLVMFPSHSIIISAWENRLPAFFKTNWSWISTLWKALGLGKRVAQDHIKLLLIAVMGFYFFSSAV